MVLILKKTKSRFRKWYEPNRERLSQKRKKRYAEDPEYRQRALEASKRYRGGERTLPKPPGAPISFAQAAELTGIGVSTLHEWRRKKCFPEPKKHHNRSLWFSEKQVGLLKNLKEFFRVYGKRRWNMTLDRLKKEVVASISANWD